MTQTNCPHARVQYLISVKTGYPYFKKFPCNKPYKCNTCAMCIGALYEQRVLNARAQGKIVMHNVMNDAQMESYRRAPRSKGKVNYLAVPVADNETHVFYIVTQGDDVIVNDDFLQAFDWTELARAKSAYAQTTPNQRANVSGKLGYKAPEPDGKEAFQDVAIHVEESIKSEAMPIIRQASAKAFQEKGCAQSVREAEVLAQRFGDLVDELMQKAGLVEYTISRVWSRDVFPVSTAQANANAENDNENSPLDDDVLEILARERQKQVLAD